MKTIVHLFLLFEEIMKDEGGKSVWDYTPLGLLGKGKTTVQEPFPGYLGTADEVTKMIQNMLKTPAQGYGGSFDIPKPGVESEVENTILGKLRNPPTVKGYSSGITDKYYAARKARLGESFDEERNKASDMYNRLGLVSSTPGIQAQSDINRKQVLQEDELSSQLMYEDIQREMDATKMVEDILSDYIGKGLALGGTQRGASQFSIQQKYQDWLNTQQQPKDWTNLGLGVLGSGKAQTIYEPGIGEQIGQMGMEMLPYLMGMSGGISGSGKQKPGVSTSGYI